MSWNGFENNVLLRHEGFDEAGQPRFSDVAMALGADDQLDSRGLAIFDLDNDGDLDMAINHNPGDTGDSSRALPTLLRNDVGAVRGYLMVRLEGRQSNRDAVGAVVTVVTNDGRRQIRQVTAGQAYASQNAQRLHFGLGDATHIESLSVRWPTGQEQQVTNIEPRRFVHWIEGQAPQVGALPNGRTPAGVTPEVASTSVEDQAVEGP